MSLPDHFPLKAAQGKTILIPSVGYGTWASGSKTWCRDATLAALKASYRHLDCAWMYGVDEQIGEAIRESGVPRSEIFVTTKFWPHFAAPQHVETCLDQCLRNMGLEYIDLFLAHWPFAFKPISDDALQNAKATESNEESGVYQDPHTGKRVIDWEHTSANIAHEAGQEGSFVPTWLALKALVGTGKTRAVGVSNFSIADLKEILPHATDVPISCNQIEVHPWLPNNELIDFMKEHDILATCYSPFAGQKADGATLLKDPAVNKLAEKNGMDVGQLLQSWAVQRGTVPLGKSQTESRIKSNLDVKKLSPEDMQILSDMGVADENGRTLDPRKDLGISLWMK